MQVYEPATEQVLAELPRAGVEQADEAVARAKAAFPAWRDVSPGDRAKLLRRLARVLEEKVEELRSSRRGTSASRSRMPVERSAASSISSTTTRERRSGCSARRSRSQAAWTSPSASLSASSA